VLHIHVLLPILAADATEYRQFLAFKGVDRQRDRYEF
jgi:hypothetical protein